MLHACHFRRTKFTSQQRAMSVQWTDMLLKPISFVFKYVCQICGIVCFICIDPIQAIFGTFHSMKLHLATLRQLLLIFILFDDLISIIHVTWRDRPRKYSHFLNFLRFYRRIECVYLKNHQNLVLFAIFDFSIFCVGSQMDHWTVWLVFSLSFYTFGKGLIERKD